MKYRLLIIFLTFISMSYAHDYHFSFAEMEYNANAQRFELSLSITLHDLERVFPEEAKEISFHQLSEPSKVKLLQWISSHFKLIHQMELLTLQWEGAELLKTGEWMVYLSSNPTKQGNEITILYDLLMDENPTQQNKLTYFEHQKNENLVFLNFTRTQTLTFIKS